MMILVDDNMCDYCGTCVGICPEFCIDLSESQLIIDDPVCTMCMKCVLVCPVEALHKSDKEAERQSDHVQAQGTKSRST